MPPKIQQQIAGLTDGGTYTFYVWAKVASGTRKASLAIVDKAYAAYLAGPTQVTLVEQIVLQYPDEETRALMAQQRALKKQLRTAAKPQRLTAADLQQPLPATGA
jgi:hypothetical protein